VAVFTIDDLDAITTNMSHDLAQQIIRSLGSYINKHFGAVGGFSSRQTINEYGTVLPYSDLYEAERIMKDFAKDFKQYGIKEYEDFEIRELDPSGGNQDPSGDYVEFSVLAGLAQGKPQIEIESVIEFARFQQKELARFKCARKGKAQ
jgi:phospholipid/cholesterol/gamma-HCH transport system ATP-binding protein